MISPYFSPIGQTEQKPYPLPDDPKLVLALLTELAAEISLSERDVSASVREIGDDFEVRIESSAFDIASNVKIGAGKTLDDVIKVLRGLLEMQRSSILSGRVPFRVGYPLPVTNPFGAEAMQ